VGVHLVAYTLSLWPLQMNAYRLFLYRPFYTESMKANHYVYTFFTALSQLNEQPARFVVYTFRNVKIMYNFFVDNCVYSVEKHVVGLVE
jgi:hypothetical protein